MIDEQIARVDRRFQAVEILLEENNSKLLDTSLPVPVWVVLNKEQRENLSQRNKKYFALNEKAKQLIAKLDKIDKKPIKELYSNRVRNNKKWLDSIALFNSNSQKINEIHCQLSIFRFRTPLQLQLTTPPLGYS